MALTVLCVVVGGLGVCPLVLAVSLTIRPNRSQFFVHQSLVLSCDLEGNSSDWRVKHEGRGPVTDVCTSSDADCSIDLLYPVDTGLYWCESGSGERGDAVTILVTDGAVILESPALPVAEGEVVTLLCTGSNSSSSSLSRFYKNDVLIGGSRTGNLSIVGVSRSDEGIYKCDVSGLGESMPGRLTIRGRPAPPAPLPVTYILLPVVVVVCLAAAIAMLLAVCRRHNGEAERDVCYSDVTFAPEARTPRLADLGSGPTCYSTLNLNTV